MPFDPFFEYVFSISSSSPSTAYFRPEFPIALTNVNYRNQQRIVVFRGSPRYLAADISNIRAVKMEKDSLVLI